MIGSWGCSDRRNRLTDRTRFGPVVLAYGIALLAAALTIVLLQEPLGGSVLLLAFAADVVATVVIFAFSVGYRNSSFYDPYWSAVPPVLVLYWMVAGGTLSDSRSLLLLALVSWWAVRLTHNWARGWQGLSDEDWRYEQLQAQLGPAYWPVSLLGIHLMPTVWVFLGCLGAYVVTGAAAVDALPWLSADELGPPAPLGVLDVLALVVTAGAVWLERRADLELLAFRQSRCDSSKLLRSGVWAWCRHPNYLGEIGFWVGVCLFGVAASTAAWWVWLGPTVMIALFAGITVAMIERKLAAAKPGYRSYQAEVPRLLPRLPPRSRRQSPAA